MQIELTKQEVQIISKALEIWEQESNSSALTTSLLGAMLCQKEEDREGWSAKTKASFEEAQNEAMSRKRTSVMLRAKLFQAMNRDSEHSLSEPTHDTI